MPHIEKIKRKNGIAHHVIWREGGKYQQKYFPAAIPYEYVQVFVKKLELRLAAYKVGLPDIIPLPDQKLTLEKLLQIYTEKRKIEVPTWRQEISLKLLIDFLSASYPINRIDHKQINNFHDWLLEKRQNGKQLTHELEQRLRRGVNNELRLLRTVFKWAFKEEYINQDIFQKVTFLKADEVSIEIFTESELDQFYKALTNDHQRLAFKLILYTGMRRSEAIRLEWNDIDFENDIVTIKRAKSGKKRLVPLDPELKKYLSKFRINNGRVLMEYSHKDSISVSFKRAIKRAGLKKRNPVHILRHQFGFSIISANPTDSQERLAQELLGHSDRKMTRHYTKLAIENLKKQLSKIDFMNHNNNE